MADTGFVFTDDAAVMRHALQLAARGIGLVEPNPAVGAVLVDQQRRLIAAGFHTRCGEAHAEIHALRSAGTAAHGARLFVTLEPCAHFGRTPPCTDAVIEAGVGEVVIGCLDPAPHTSGRGVERLKNAGIPVTVGVCEHEARHLIAPFEQLMCHGRPWVHAKWAMTLDGKIASRSGHSQWITNEDSRAKVHRLRGIMDAVVTGSGTARHDDPLLTTRPPGPRTPMRIVVDSDGTAVKENSRLITTVAEAPVMICVRRNADAEHCRRLQNAGAEILVLPTESPADQVSLLLTELGQRKMTNILIEAGSGLLGTFFDLQLIDEVHVYIAPKLVG
ncbi:MAG: bifunctional diaminohydroxyphosphoribosylaminopyrimidine deaminase/5-amino-6-(5-phosphoribosylamino)uracil reductase RibD, partial [Planctomycetaceae bacterium]|nr:bifunctional diaminohydroxyphosphoribosylaminopyrimidine deaminase/5-amino-6-(5-phosphoribosylamino)uracil reductase RibD [Planctomycetaceae bacterium]